jgi:magnesium-transporting ATPase (P-type)
MNTKDKREIEAVNIQFYALIFTLISSIISIIITYNQKRELKGKDPMFSGKEIFNITLFNRILILVLSFVFLYVNYTLYEISKEQKEDLKPYKLQLLASTLVIVSGIIALYVVSLSNTENISDVENPII